MESGKENTRLAALLNEAAVATPSASRPWALCCLRATNHMLVRGWFKTQKDARQVGVWFGDAQPIVAKLYTPLELSIAARSRT